MSRLRILSYAINGRGMGHLVRQLAILRWIRRICAVIDQPVELWILTSSEADTLARREGIPALKMPSKAMLRDAGIQPARYLRVARTWTLNTVANLAPDLLIVDTFPGGSFGELIAALELAEKRVLVARRVRPDFASESGYQALLPLYDTIIRPDGEGTGPILIREREELLSREAARSALGIPDGQASVYVSLGGGGDARAGELLPRLVRHLRKAGHFVVVGAGPLYDGEEIRGEGITWLDRYVPIEVLPGIDKAISAGGYNSFHELMFVGIPTVFLPQPRIADDQRERVQRAVDAGAGLLATNEKEAVALLDKLPMNPEACRSLAASNGAALAALETLSQVLPRPQLEQAIEVLQGDVLRWMHSAKQPKDALELIRLFAAGKCMERAIAVFEQTQIPLEVAVNLCRSLSRKFPSAEPEELAGAIEILFPVWSGFEDWMGAVTLLRAVPVQRSYAIGAFSADMARWLSSEEDLFDALRDFSHREGNGRMPVAGVLRQFISGCA
jgi:UDP-N-acetylglucosamine--N-acetylmuramyl-(pentapeptide) pyrophosphoryl-undecaprenol N-acetylglucosamine transferase